MLNDHKNWEVSTDKTDSAEISRWKKWTVLTANFIDKWGAGAIRSWWITSRGQLPGGEYSVEIATTPVESGLSAYLYNAKGEPLNQDGTPATPGKTKVFINNWTNIISIPKNCTSIWFHAIVSPVNSTFELTKIEFKPSPQKLVVNKRGF
jgi:hypothetical protein